MPAAVCEAEPQHTRGCGSLTVAALAAEPNAQEEVDDRACAGIGAATAPLAWTDSATTRQCEQSRPKIKLVMAIGLI